MAANAAEGHPPVGGPEWVCGFLGFATAKGTETAEALCPRLRGPPRAAGRTCAGFADVPPSRAAAGRSFRGTPPPPSSPKGGLWQGKPNKTTKPLSERRLWSPLSEGAPGRAICKEAKLEGNSPNSPNPLRKAKRSRMRRATAKHADRPVGLWLWWVCGRQRRAARAAGAVGTKSISRKIVWPYNSAKTVLVSLRIMTKRLCL